MTKHLEDALHRPEVMVVGVTEEDDVVREQRNAGYGAPACEAVENATAGGVLDQSVKHMGEIGSPCRSPLA